MQLDETLNMRALREAFAEMRRRGVLAEEDLLCCQTCGAAEMESLAQRSKRRPIGYCFFHGQDTESLVASGTAMLSYAGVGETSDRDVGAVVVDCLRRAGVMHQWSGDERHRIEFSVARKIACREYAVIRSNVTGKTTVHTAACKAVTAAVHARVHAVVRIDAESPAEAIRLWLDMYGDLGLPRPKVCKCAI